MVQPVIVAWIKEARRFLIRSERHARSFGKTSGANS